MSLDTIELRGFAGGGEIEVPCDRIDAQLDAIWRGIAKRAQAEGGRRISVHRACLLNLLVHAGDGPSEVVARYLATALTDRLPARVIVVRAKPSATASGAPRAFVAGSRSPLAEEGHGSAVSGELVILEAAGAQLDRVPAVVRAVLVPDLATTLWWTGPLPPARPYVAALRDLADRVVVDSDGIPDDAALSHVLPPAGSGRLADLAWPRLAPWRTAVARAFDPPEHRPFLAAIDAVRVSIGVQSRVAHPDASVGPLVAGWLASALGWPACRRGEDREIAFCASPGAPAVRVSIEAQRSDHRGVVAVSLSAGERTVHFTRTRAGTVEASVPAGFAPVRPVAFRDVDALEALGSTLLEIHTDPIAPDAIHRAAEIAAALGAA